MAEVMAQIDAQLEGMTDAERADHLYGLLRARLVTELKQAASICDHIPMPRRAAQTMAILWERRGRIVDYETLRVHIEASMPDRIWVDSTLIATHVKHIRRALRASGMPIEIRTHYGMGYSLVVPDGWQAPWETDAQNRRTS